MLAQSQLDRHADHLLILVRKTGQRRHAAQISNVMHGATLLDAELIHVVRKYVACILINSRIHQTDKVKCAPSQTVENSLKNQLYSMRRANFLLMTFTS